MKVSSVLVDSVNQKLVQSEVLEKWKEWELQGRKKKSKAKELTSMNLLP